MRLGATLLPMPQICAALAYAGGGPATTNGSADTSGGAQLTPDQSAADSERPDAGGDVPAGFAGRTDDPAESLSGARYRAAAGQVAITPIAISRG
jgi:hypothetical protein